MSEGPSSGRGVVGCVAARRHEKKRRRRTGWKKIVAGCVRDDFQVVPGQRSAQHTSASSPGPDGIPLQARRLLGALGTDVLWDFQQVQCKNAKGTGRGRSK